MTSTQAPAVFYGDLDALPVHSVILDARELAWQKQVWGFSETETWFQAGDERPADKYCSPLPPVMLLWKPETK